MQTAVPDESGVRVLCALVRAGRLPAARVDAYAAQLLAEPGAPVEQARLR